VWPRIHERLVDSPGAANCRLGFDVEERKQAEATQKVSSSIVSLSKLNKFWTALKKNQSTALLPATKIKTHPSNWMYTL